MSPALSYVGTAAITENMLKRRWSSAILHFLSRGINVPAEILKRETQLSSKVLTERLRTMLRYGLVQRFPHPAPSSVIEYRLTPLGRRILEMLDAIDQLEIDLHHNPRLENPFKDSAKSATEPAPNPAAGSESFPHQETLKKSVNQ